MTRYLLGFAALAASTAATADPITLWNGLTTETTAAQVLQQFPNAVQKSKYTQIDHYPITATCTVQIFVNHPRGTVNNVNFHWHGSQCATDLSQSLTAKYNLGLRRVPDRPFDIDETWAGDHVMIRMQAGTTFLPEGYLSYTPAPSSTTTNI